MAPIQNQAGPQHTGVNQQQVARTGNFPYGIDPFSNGPPVELPMESIGNQVAYVDRINGAQQGAQTAPSPPKATNKVDPQAIVSYAIAKAAEAAARAAEKDANLARGIIPINDANANFASTNTNYANANGNFANANANFANPNANTATGPIVDNSAAIKAIEAAIQARQNAVGPGIQPPSSAQQQAAQEKRQTLRNNLSMIKGRLTLFGWAISRTQMAVTPFFNPFPK